MPYKIEERDGQHCVIKEADGSVEKCHATRDDADMHMKALYAAEDDKGFTPDDTALVEHTVTDSNGKSLVERIAVKLFGERDPTATGFKVVGNHWFITWSNNFEDRDGEIFTAKAIDDYVARVDMGIVPPPELWVWHIGKQVRVGQAEWVAEHGHFLTAFGQFDGNPAAQRAKDYYRRNAKNMGVSHGFAYDARQFDGKHYHQFNTFEISPMPRGKEANRFTTLERIKEMALTPDKIKHLEDVFGKDHAAEILADLETRGKALEEIGVAYKDFASVTDAAETPAVEEAVKDIDGNFKDFVRDLLGDSAEVLTMAATAIKQVGALTKRVEQLETTNAALKEQLDSRPRRASQDDVTDLTNVQIDALKAEAEKQAKTRDPFWGTEVTVME